MIVTMVFALCVSAFADKSRFYEDGKVIDTMYVDSPEGLRVRDAPSLKSNRICGLTHRLPVKIVAIGKEETIDGITAPWVEILIPRYEWKSDEPEYGWVFGGYLSKEQPEFIKPRTKDEFTQFLESSYWYLYWEYGGTGDERFGYFENGKLYAITVFENNWNIQKIPFLVNFRAVSGNEYYSDKYSFLMSPAPPYVKEKVEQFLFIQGTFEITWITNDNFTNYGGSACNYDFAWVFYPHKQFPVIDDSKNPVLNNKRIYAIIENKNIMQWLYKEKDLNEDVAMQLIKIGISAKDTGYEEYYKKYWDPIMREHQKKADEMQ